MPARPSLRALLIAASLLLGLRAASAQSDPSAFLAKQHQQSVQLAPHWLASSDPRFRAWGAYLVLRDRLIDLTPALLSMVNSYEASPEPDKDQHDAMLPVLDALIQLNIPVPASDAAKLLPEFPAQSLILLSRLPDGAAAEILNIFRTAQDQSGTWLAAGNILAQRRAPGFAAAVLSGMTVHAEVTITSPEEGSGFGSREGGSMACGFGYQAAAKAGWPEVGNYSLSVCSNAGAIVLAPGADTAYYLRRTDALYSQNSGQDCGRGLNPELVRERFLATLLWAPQSHPPLRAYASASISWSGDSSYTTEVQSFVLRQQEKFAAIAQRLRAAELLTPEEASTSRPSLHVVIDDRRQHAHAPLPALAPLDAGPAKVSIAFAQ